MKKVGFLITNPNHHWQIIEPIIANLKSERGICPVVISLCGLRRMKDPINEINRLDIESRLGPSLTSRVGVKQSSGKVALGSGNSFRRRLVQATTWYGWLQLRLPRLFVGLDGLVLLNDVAFPTSYLLKRLRRKTKTWIGLLQEGIRFPLPNESPMENYGASDLDCIFAWGEASARFFSRRKKHNNTKVIITGNPRINQKLSCDWSGVVEQLVQKYRPIGPIIGFASNPIDDQGFCTNVEKLKIFHDFFIEALPFLVSKQGQLWIKLHPRENREEIMAIIRKLHAMENIKIFDESCVFSFISCVGRVIVLASTVGLESLAFGKPIAVLPIPGHGFVHDYVSHGAALGLEFGKIGEQLSLWKNTTLSREALNYVEQNLSVSSQSISLICETIQRDLSNYMA